MGARVGCGVGGGAVAMSSCVVKRRFGEPKPGSLTTPEIPPDNKASLTCAGVIVGSFSKYRAATPAACWKGK